jgi:bile acid:Na+ symporter, BASS family
MKSLIARNWRTAGLIFSMALGAMLPCLESLHFMVRFLIMLMLFFAFLNLDTKKGMICKTHAILLVIPPVTAVLAYCAIVRFDEDVALAAFLVAITPTATASPVVTGILGGNPAYPAFMVFASSITQPLFISLALPFMIEGRRVTGLSDILVTILSTIVIPFLSARLIVTFLPRISAFFSRIKPISFPLWLFVLCIATAEASYFLRRTSAPFSKLAGIAVVTLVLCVFLFWLGRKIGGKEYGIEASQSLGQKNTIFTIWVALTFISPLVSLGPAFYIICHNCWNAWQMHSHRVRHNG